MNVLEDVVAFLRWLAESTGGQGVINEAHQRLDALIERHRGDAPAGDGSGPDPTEAGNPASSSDS